MVPKMPAVFLESGQCHLCGIQTADWCLGCEEPTCQNCYADDNDVVCSHCVKMPCMFDDATDEEVLARFD